MGECALLVPSPQSDQGVIGNLYEMDRLSGSEYVLAFIHTPTSVVMAFYRL